jgi:hypothetical protein
VALTVRNPTASFRRLVKIRAYRPDSLMMVLSCGPPGVYIVDIPLSWGCKPGGGAAIDTRSCISGVIIRAKTARQKATSRKRRDDPRYRIAPLTVVRDLEITEAEMLSANLRVLITPPIKKIRTRERQQDFRLRKGSVPRSIYLGRVGAKADDNAEQILALLRELGTHKAVAEHLGISTNTVKQRLHRGRLYLSDRLQGPSRKMVGAGRDGGDGPRRP